MADSAAPQLAMRSVVIGTAGHIDHGKTALVEALTGIHTSRLSEEKRRGITIDLGFAFRELQMPDGSSLLLSFVDVPGHSQFIRNMLAGAGGIDFVLLAISAQEGIKPQTIEHLAICRLLGIKRGVAVLTKIDAVDPARLAAARQQTIEFLRGTFLENVEGPLPVSSRTGEGIPLLISRLESLAAEVTHRDETALVRLPVDRAFGLRGFGTVVTGTLVQGTIELNQRLTVEPGGAPVRVRNIQTHGRDYAYASPGSRVALNLTGVDAKSIARGCTLVAPGTLSAVSVFDAELRSLPNAPELRHQSEMSFHVFAADTTATLLLYRKRGVEPGGTALARLKLRDPVVVAPGDRFILRLPSPSETVAGGTVVEICPQMSQSKALSLRWLEPLVNALPETIILLRTARQRLNGLDTTAAMRETGMSERRIGELVDDLVQRRKLTRIGDGGFVLTSDYDSGLQALRSELSKFHAASPEQAGMKRAELRAAALLPEPLFTASLGDLSGRQAVQLRSDLVALSEFVPQLSAKDLANIDKIAALYAKAGFETPQLRDIAVAAQLSAGDTQRTIAALVQSKILGRIGVDAYAHRDTLAGLRAKLAPLRGRSLDVAQFKQMIGLSRKYAVPWLEYLDREHLTRRAGDVRQIL